MALQLRPPQRADREPLAALANDSRVAAYLRDRFPHPYRPEDADQYLDYLEEYADVALARIIHWQDTMVGLISVERSTDLYRFNGEIGYWIGSAFWGKGITSTALGQFCTFLFESDFMIKRLEATVFEQHTSSIRVLEKNGFQREGCRTKALYKHGRFHDELLYARINPNWPKQSF
ncbi:GNAT family N-acetyltransferase [Acanthopleuribacter pedis]|uniref:GNAT family N-acetyltransferase n=1 Tax=Acanthopleuribacter pedis TaxID=442870 RepID=A0A8J7QCH3_9BACT|nr:GNAT family N-acetyltransferase [Acanthopleuribacter pedis]MBO1317015.1 GNAT family N-acetyltransferase [Acanthopleuribacter pedis]